MAGMAMAVWYGLLLLVSVGDTLQLQSVIKVESLGQKGVQRVTSFVEVPSNGLIFTQLPKVAGRNITCSTQKEGTQVFCELGALKPTDGAIALTFGLTAKAAGRYSVAASVDCRGDVKSANNRDVVQVTVLGACCQYNTSTCAGVATAADCAADSFQPDQPCATAVCKPRTPLGVCCSLSAECSPAKSQEECQPGGRHFPNLTCDSAVCLSSPAEDMCGSVTSDPSDYGDYNTSNPGASNTSSPEMPAGPMRFTCPEGMEFNESALTAFPAAVDTCCMATCANADVYNNKPVPFKCPEGYNYLARNSNLTNPDTDVCCAPRFRPETVPDVSIKQSGMLKTQNIGGDTIIVLTVKAEDGTAGADAVRVTVNIPIAFKLASCTPTAGGCTVTGQELYCDLGYIALGKTADIGVAMKPVRAGSYQVSARVTCDNDKNDQNNKVDVTVSVLGVCCTNNKVKIVSAVNQCNSPTKRFYATRTDKQVDCKATTGACCRQDGSCSTETKPVCATFQGSRWTRNGACSAAACPAPTGACCSPSTGQCSATTHSLCTGVWAAGARCAAASCPAPCVQAFAPCVQDSNSCCSGLTCALLPAPFPGSKSTHACQPAGIACAPANRACGPMNPGGGSVTCCPGLVCIWDFIFRSGTCQKPLPGLCGVVGTNCKYDSDCCRGHRCGGDAFCRLVQCHRSCSTIDCEAERRIDCSYQQYAIASAAAETAVLPAPGSSTPAP